MQIRDLLAGARGSRITLGFTNNYGTAYDVDLVRNVRSTKKPASSYGSQRGARPASWQVHGDNLGPPPLYEGLQVRMDLRCRACTCKWQSEIPCEHMIAENCAGWTMNPLPYY
jgi:hypothetical protein